MVSFSHIKTAIKDPRRGLVFLILGKRRFGELYKPHSACFLVKNTTTYLESRMTKPTSMHEHLTTLYMLTIELDLKNVLELGTQHGESTIALLQAVKEIGGRLTSIDINPCLGAEKLVSELHLDKYWTFIQSDDLKVEWGDMIDHLFIDTAHTYEHVLAELTKYEPFVRPGGLITMHDIIHDPPVLAAITKYIENRSDLKLYKYFNCMGLGIIRKTKSISNLNT